MLLATDWPSFLIAEGQVMRSAAYEYHDEDYDHQFSAEIHYRVSPAEPSVGVPQSLEITAIRVRRGFAWVGGVAANFKPSDDLKCGWEAQIERRLNAHMRLSPAYRDAMLQACWKDYGADSADLLSLA